MREDDRAPSEQETTRGKPELDEQSTDQSDPSRVRSALRFASLGTELAAFALTFAGIGFVIDSARGHDKSYATAFGTLIGFILGMVRFIVEVTKKK